MVLATSSVAGIVAGRDPLVWSSGDPLTLFLFQAVFILVLCQLVHIPLSLLRQPRVIAEVISGILLGPSVLGRIPNFTDKCFPSDSIPPLTLVANIGLVFFLFLVGLEVDVKFIKKNMKVALSVGLINMVIPFGFGCAIAVGFWREYGENFQSDNANMKFTTYMVFIAVATCATALPVLARILSELRILQERVGTIALAAGITNDIIGWMLLALSVTLANSGSGINTLYILLITIGWGLFMLFPVRWVLVKFLLRKDLQRGSLSRLSILMILIILFISSFFTDIIGVHPIFGAFIAGLIVPRDHGFVIELTNKIEDLVQIVFIPIYFTLAGFNVNLEELNQGVDWAYIIALTALAILTKIFGGTISARWNGYFWRESLTVGILMSCKGIVEIVVLTVGFNAEIISSKVFSMFIVMTLIATFLTTPLTLWAYPVSYREKARKYLNGEIDWDGTELERVNTRTSDETFSDKFSNDFYKFEKLIYNIDDVDGILSLLNFTELFYGTDILKNKPPSVTQSDKDQIYEANASKNVINVSNGEVLGGSFKPPLNAVFLTEISDRTADLIAASTLEDHDRLHDTKAELLSKIFEYNEIPYMGDFKYYVGEDKLWAYLDVSSNPEDFLIYSIGGNQIDSKLVEILNVKQVVPHFGLLIKNNSNKKFKELSVCFSGDDKEDDVNSLILYLLKTIVNHNPNITTVKVICTSDIEQGVSQNYLNVLKDRIKVDTDVIDDINHASGLLISPLNVSELKEFTAKSQAVGLDALLVGKK